MQYVDLLSATKGHGCLSSFAEELFSAVNVPVFEERESSNYVDGHYFKGAVGNLSFKVSNSDEAGYDGFPYWIQVAADVGGTKELAGVVDSIVRQNLLMKGFRMIRVVNLGRNDEQHVSYQDEAHDLLRT